MKTPSDLRLMATTANIMVLARAYRGAADKALADYGLSQALAWPVIMVARLGDGVRQGVLAESLGVEGPSLVRIIDQLVGSGLVERHEDPGDRRARTIHLTRAGRALSTRVEAVLADLRRELFAGISDEDLAVCQRVFETLKTALGRESAMSGASMANKGQQP